MLQATEGMGVAGGGHVDAKVIMTAAHLLGDTDTGVASSETDAVNCRMLSQVVSNLRPLA